ncbi:Putative uncharacterized protein FLJ37770 [Araneus ventricosus]|uniref:Mos1 transposase HTH domain-containing protein n=1 Tax=Araneus ventricosus TaxID=182803 RepID=A0A4Y2B1T6_ARAVE|nr:Putative uncharacterized protein FLJ37770 [Araneus ventricosus]
MKSDLSGLTCQESKLRPERSRRRWNKGHSIYSLLEPKITLRPESSVNDVIVLTVIRVCNRHIPLRTGQDWSEPVPERRRCECAYRVETAHCRAKVLCAVETQNGSANEYSCLNFGKSAKETHELLMTVYEERAVTLKCVYEWFKRFREGRDTIEDALRTGRPTTARIPDNIQNVKKCLVKNRRVTVRMIAEEMIV